jgi:hypothetical protein
MARWTPARNGEPETISSRDLLAGESEEACARHTELVPDRALPIRNPQVYSATFVIWPSVLPDIE